MRQIRYPLVPHTELRGFGIPSLYPGTVLNGWNLAEEAEKLDRSCHFEEEEIKALFQQFLTLATTPKSASSPGGITRATFDACIGVLGKDQNLINDRIYKFYDRDGDGVISFPEFVSSLGILTKGSLEERIQFNSTKNATQPSLTPLQTSVMPGFTLSEVISLVVGILGGYAILAYNSRAAKTKTTSTYADRPTEPTDKSANIPTFSFKTEDTKPTTKQEILHQTLQHLETHIKDLETAVASNEPMIISPISLASSSASSSPPPWSHTRLGVFIPATRIHGNSPTSAINLPSSAVSQTRSQVSPSSPSSVTTRFSHLSRKSAVSQSSPLSYTASTLAEDANGFEEVANLKKVATQLPFSMDEILGEYCSSELDDDEEEAGMSEETFTTYHVNQVKRLVNLLDSFSQQEDETDALVHRSIQCNHCQSQIRGVRYNCLNCTDYSLCQACERLGDVHTITHVMVKIRYPLAPHTELRGFGIPSLYPGTVLNGWNLAEEAEKLDRSCHFEEEEIKALFQQFLTLATTPKSASNPGGITRATFDACIGVLGKDQNLINDRIYKFYDRDGDGVISFPEFVSSLGILTKGSLEERIQYAFNGYDLNGDGVLSRVELQRMFKAYYQLSMQLVQQYSKDFDSSKSLTESQTLPDSTSPTRLTAVLSEKSVQEIQAVRNKSRASLVTSRSPTEEMGSLLGSLDKMFVGGGSGGAFEIPVTEAMSQDVVDEMVDGIFRAGDASNLNALTFMEFERAARQDSSYLQWFDAFGSVF
ncbi:hypothetical protein HDU80_010706 [Chytriomyces hyalinus]|nr:hypothetical protein HDU80_010706 [Chytriomyces hyalinus]